MRCHNCGSDKTESDSASGTSYCINCGTVLEENTIVAEVTFGETSGGKAILQGSYAGESGRISGGGLFGRNRGREGQEQAIENGRVKISSLAHATRLPERYRDSAQRYYNLAVVNRFTRGRRSDHVAAVCLYAVCRSEKSSHMLIDFSDILQVNVFTLGATFLKLCRILNLQLPHVDPSLYISRFAVALDFGDYTQRIAQDAVRIAQRMDRDWITSGRRPAGICGACLLIAARMNGFRRTTSEMIHIVKVAEITIQKRLQEFNQTESAQLSVRDFRTIWLENRADPPSFQKNKKLAAKEEKRRPLMNGDEDDQLEDDELEQDKENAALIASRKRKGKERADQRRASLEATISSKLLHNKPKKRRLIKKVEAENELDTSESENSEAELTDEEVNGPFSGSQKGLSAADNGVFSKGGKVELSKNKAEAQEEDELITEQIEETLNEEIKHVADIDVSLTAEAIIKTKEDPDATQVESQQTDLMMEDDTSTLVNNHDEDDDEVITLKNNPTYDEMSIEEKKMLTAIAKEKIAREEKELLNPDLQNDAKEIQEDIETWLQDDSIMKAAGEIEKQKHGVVSESESEDESDGNLSEVDDEEIEAMILTPEEILLKTKIWYNANKQYLEEMAIRRMVEKDKQPGSRKGKNGKKKKLPPASTPAEAAKQLLEKKKMSKKINQAVFDDMFESAESIAKIKQRDVLSRLGKNNGSSALLPVPEYEVVEEPGDVPDSKKKAATKTGDNASTDKPAAAAEEPENAEAEDDDDEEMDSDDMADDERFLRDQRAKLYADDDADVPEYYSDEENW